jgi:hypothetical protein
MEEVPSSQRRAPLPHCGQVRGWMSGLGAKIFDLFAVREAHDRIYAISQILAGLSSEPVARIAPRLRIQHCRRYRLLPGRRPQPLALGGRDPLEFGKRQKHA